MTELIICEKPSAALKVATALSEKKLNKHKDGQVSFYELERGNHKIFVGCCVGHLYGLEQKTDKRSYPVYDIGWKEKKAGYVKKYIKTLKRLAKQATEFTVACDYDIEGEVIGWNALRFACKKNDGNRMKFSTLTKPDLIEAYNKKLKHIDWGQAHAGETRHKLDWLYGINLSRALISSIMTTRKYHKLSIGRVQGPSLKFLVDREREIKAFIPKAYWEIHLNLKKDKSEFDVIHKNKKIWEKEKAQKIYNTIKDEKKAKVKNIKKREYKQNAPHPFDLTSLQTEAYRQFKVPPKQTSSIAQNLYSNSYISYPRTSSQQLDPKLGFKKIIGMLATNGKYTQLCEKLSKKKTLKPNNGKKKDPAHPAIYPTGITPNKLEGREAKVYDLIVKRFLATFGDPAIKESLKVEFDVKGEEFLGEGKTTKENGWYDFYKPYVREKDTELPLMEKDEFLDIKKKDLQDKETQPPKRYTPSSIIKELERRNLGTKATRADIIEKLFDRNYAEGNPIQATTLGIATVDTIEKYEPDILNEEMTRDFEEKMENIREGKEKPESIISKAKKVLDKILSNFKKHEVSIGKELISALKETEEKTNYIGKCPKCGKNLMIKHNHKTKQQFAACSGYPECKTTFPLPQRVKVKPIEKACDVCGYPMITFVKARRKQEMCINPNCKSKVNKDAEREQKNHPHGKKCPKCGADLVLRKSFYGEFFGCSKYPKCRYIEKIEKKDDKKTSKKKSDKKSKK